MEGLPAKLQKATDALMDCGLDDDSINTRLAVEAIVDAAQERFLHDLGRRDARVQEALRAAGLIA